MSRLFREYSACLAAFGFAAMLVSAGSALAQTKGKKPEAKPAAAASAGIAIPPPGPAELPLFEAREFTDPRTSLELTVPAGWIVVEIARVPKDAVSMLVFDGPGSPSPSCRLGIRTPKQPGKITQAQINKIMHDGRNLAMVKANLEKDGRSVIAVNKLIVRGINGVQGQMVVPGNDRRPDVTMVVNFFETVGRAYSFECTVMSADYANIGKDIDAIVKSLRFANS